MSNPDFDRELERTVRRMLDVCPAADLRARVVARLGQRERRIPWARTVLGAAAAALVVVALLPDGPAPAPVVTPADQKAESAPINVPAAVPPAAATPAVSARRAVVRRDDLPSAPLPRTPDELPPIVVAEIAVAPPAAPEEIEPPEIVIAPLAEPANVIVNPLPFPPGARE